MPDDQTATMIANLPDRTGRSLDEWFAVLEPLKLDRHGQIMTHLKDEHSVSHGFANLISHMYRSRHAAEPTPDELIAAQYAGAKAHLRSIYDAIASVAHDFGDDVEIAPKKASVSLRRSKQFALVEPATRSRVDLGLNLKGEPATQRMRAVTGMCTHKVAITDVAEVDDEVVSLLRLAYDRA